MNAQEIRMAAESLMKLSYLAEQGVHIGDDFKISKKGRDITLEYNLTPVCDGKIIKFKRTKNILEDGQAGNASPC